MKAILVLTVTAQGNQFLLSMAIALTRILETVVTFHFGDGKVYSMNKGYHTCMIKYTMHVQSLHCFNISYLARCVYIRA